MSYQQLLNGRVERDALWLPENPYQTIQKKVKTVTHTAQHAETTNKLVETTTAETPTSG